MCPLLSTTSLPKVLELSCWNINGLSKKSIFGNKLCNNDFLKALENSDIIILTELWGNQVEDIPNFEIIAMSPPQKYSTAKSGRFSVQTDKDISLCSCYIPPKESPYYDSETFSNLEHDINIYQKDSYVILAGDFNARTGSKNDFITSDSCKVVPGDSLPMPNEVPIRKNFDQHLNDHGKILLEICKSLDIRILNGRCKGDSFGKITFHGQQGISTVDYMILVMSYWTDFKILLLDNLLPIQTTPN